MASYAGNTMLRQLKSLCIGVGTLVEQPVQLEDVVTKYSLVQRRPG